MSATATSGLRADDLTAAGVSRQLRVMSNLAGLAGTTLPSGRVLELIPHRPIGRRWWAIPSVLWLARRCDVVLINCSPRELYWMCLARLLWPWSRWQLVSLDTVLPVPNEGTLAARFTLAAKRMLFKQPHVFIEYFKNTAGYEHYYGIDKRKFRYVPFKVNRLERILETKTTDGGYVFCGGITRRDFATLIEAVRQLPYPVKIVTLPEFIIQRSGSTVDSSSLPDTVEVVRHDKSDSFIDYIAGARLVVLPIKKANISASGIGVYLASMALGKCVIISQGPAVDGVVPPGAAVIVPAEDPEALRQAIRSTYEDDSLRGKTAERGRAYALGLGGETQLCASVGAVVDTLSS